MKHNIQGERLSYVSSPYVIQFQVLHVTPYGFNGADHEYTCKGLVRCLTIITEFNFVGVRGVTACLSSAIVITNRSAKKCCSFIRSRMFYSILTR